MFIPKCKKCGGKVISAYTNIEIETNGVLKTVTNTPAKKCSKCGHIIVDDITMEKAKSMPMIILQIQSTMQCAKPKKL